MAAAAKKNPIDQTRLSLAALFACMVDALSNGDPKVIARFKENLANAYEETKDMPLSHIGVFETLKWTHDYFEPIDRNRRSGS